MSTNGQPEQLQRVRDEMDRIRVLLERIHNIASRLALAQDRLLNFQASAHARLLLELAEVDQQISYPHRVEEALASLWRGFEHDLRNYFSTITGYIELVVVIHQHLSLDAPFRDFFDDRATEVQKIVTALTDHQARTTRWMKQTPNWVMLSDSQLMAQFSPHQNRRIMELAMGGYFPMRPLLCGAILSAIEDSYSFGWAAHEVAQVVRDKLDVVVEGWEARLLVLAEEEGALL